MRMTVIGCAGSYPGPESAASCYLLEEEHGGRTWSVLLDLGNGALGSLQRYADASAIDAVFLSHLHADHCLDLCGYYVMRKYHPNGALPRIPVWGPADTARRMAKAYDLDEDPGMNEEFDFIPYGADAVEYGPFNDHRPARRTPRDGVRTAHRGRRPHAGLLGRQRCLPRARGHRARRRPVPVRGVLPRGQARTRRTCT